MFRDALFGACHKISRVATVIARYSSFPTRLPCVTVYLYAIDGATCPAFPSVVRARFVR